MDGSEKVLLYGVETRVRRDAKQKKGVRIGHADPSVQAHLGLAKQYRRPDPVLRANRERKNLFWRGANT